VTGIMRAVSHSTAQYGAALRSICCANRSRFECCATCCTAQYCAQCECLL